MSGTVPPPLPAGGPPPPLPSIANLPPPPFPSTSGPPLPLPSNHHHLLPPPRHHPGIVVAAATAVVGPPLGGRGGMRLPFTNTLLITNVPRMFHGYTQVRDLLYPCGTAKSCVFSPRVPKRNRKNSSSSKCGEDRCTEETNNTNNNNETQGGEGGNDSIDGTTVPDAMTEMKSHKTFTVLVNMLNPDQALKVVACFKAFTKQLESRYQDMRCYMVPSSPDVPLPPPLVDETTQKVLSEKLVQNFTTFQNSLQNKARNDNNKENTNDTDETMMATTGNNNEEVVTTKNTSNNEDGQKLDADKVAAAAGGVGAYDVDEDPLNAPNVLAAVKEFRRKLDKTQGSQKTKRAELVAKKLKEARPKLRLTVDDEQKTRQERLQQHQQHPNDTVGVSLPVPPAQTSLPQPPLPGGGGGPPPLPLPPPSLGLPPPPRVNDSGKRGRSNLPAWMTKPQQHTASTEDAPANKKSKTTADNYPSHFPSALPASSLTVLRQFVATQVRESLGIEDATLIEFIYTHIIQGKATSELLQELRVVLEEEADGFLDAVWTKVKEIK